MLYPFWNVTDCKDFYNIGLAAKIPLKTATSDNGDVCFLARLLWSLQM